MHKIYHYTTLESLFLIIKNRSLRFTSLGNLDDTTESLISDFGNIAEYCYVSCWTKNGEESIPQWNMYSDRMHGLRLELEFDNEDDLFDMVEYKFEDGVKNISKSLNPDLMGVMGANPPFKPQLIPITYTDDSELINLSVAMCDERDKDNYTTTLKIDQIGKFKPKAWSFQNEVRFKIFLTPWSNMELKDITEKEQFDIHKKLIYRFKLDRPFINYFDILLSETFFEKLSIIVGPKCTEAQFGMLNLIIEKFNKNITIKKSVLKIR